MNYIHQTFHSPKYPSRELWPKLQFAKYVDVSHRFTNLIRPPILCHSWFWPIICCRCCCCCRFWGRFMWSCRFWIDGWCWKILWFWSRAWGCCRSWAWTWLESSVWFIETWLRLLSNIIQLPLWLYDKAHIWLLLLRQLHEKYLLSQFSIPR